MFDKQNLLLTIITAILLAIALYITLVPEAQAQTGCYRSWNQYCCPVTACYWLRRSYGWVQQCYTVYQCRTIRRGCYNYYGAIVPCY